MGAPQLHHPCTPGCPAQSTAAANEDAGKGGLRPGSSHSHPFTGQARPGPRGDEGMSQQTFQSGAWRAGALWGGQSPREGPVRGAWAAPRGPSGTPGSRQQPCPAALRAHSPPSRIPTLRDKTPGRRPLGPQTWASARSVERPMAHPLPWKDEASRLRGIQTRCLQAVQGPRAPAGGCARPGWPRPSSGSADTEETAPASCPGGPAQRGLFTLPGQRPGHPEEGGPRPPSVLLPTSQSHRLHGGMWLQLRVTPPLWPPPVGPALQPSPGLACSPPRTFEPHRDKVTRREI